MVLSVFLGRNGTAFEGVEISLSRSISGRRLNFRWRGTTGVKGRAEITIEADPQTRLKNVSSYYVAQATDGTSGTVLDRWGSIPVRSDETSLLVLDVGQRSRFVPCLL